MGRFMKGEVVVLPFPFSDLSNSKRRPALVVAGLTGDDVILCMITGKGPAPNSISLSSTDFQQGDLRRPCYIRPDRIFTADSNIVEYPIGKINLTKMEEVTSKIIDIFTN